MILEQSRFLKNEVAPKPLNTIGSSPTLSIKFYKEVNEIIDAFGYELLISYLKENESYLSSVMQEKDFPKEYGKIRYFAAILKNSLADYENTSDKNDKEYEKYIEYDLPEMKFKRNKKKRSLSEIETEVGGWL